MLSYTIRSQPLSHVRLKLVKSYYTTNSSHFKTCWYVVLLAPLPRVHHVNFQVVARRVTSLVYLNSPTVLKVFVVSVLAFALSIPLLKEHGFDMAPEDH